MDSGGSSKDCGGKCICRNNRNGTFRLCSSLRRVCK